MNSSRRRLGVRSLLARIASRGRAARRFSGALAVALAAIGLMPTAAAAADSSLEQVIDMVVQPRASQLIVRLHVPAAALAGAALPHLPDGRLDSSAIDVALRIVAADIGRNLDVRQDDGPLGAPLAAARVGGDQRSVDVELTYTIDPQIAGISARLNAFRAEQRPVRTQVQYVPSSGAAQIISVSGAPARVLFDPGPAHALTEIVVRGLRTLLDGGDQLLLLICLLVPLRKLRPAARLVAAMALGQATTMIVTAGRLDVTADALTALAMVAASAVVIAALQNIVGARFRWTAAAAFAFGLLNGFAFGGSFLASAPYAGAHQRLAFAAFFLVVELGQFWLAAILWATRQWLDSRGVAERTIALFASVVIAHEALHRVADRGRLLAPSGSFGGERAIVWLVLGWTAVMLSVAIANALSAHADGEAPAQQIAHA
jgi:hypothetical protein